MKRLDLWTPGLRRRVMVFEFTTNKQGLALLETMAVDIMAIDTPADGRIVVRINCAPKRANHGFELLSSVSGRHAVRVEANGN